MIPFYTQGQNYPFSSWQSRNFGIYPKNVKVAPSFYISLRTAFPPGISGMSVPQPALHYKTRGRQGRTNAALHVPFQAGASARRNSCLSWNRKSPLCVCPGRPLSDPPGRTLILPLLHTFYTHPVFPLISSPECFFLLAMPSGFVGRKGLSSCLNCPD